jgi:hypothetical protein
LFYLQIGAVLATDYELDDESSGVQFLARAGNFSLLHCIQPCSGAYPPIPNGYWELFPWGRMWPKHEADHSTSPSVKVKNAWHYTSTPLYIFVAWCLVKHRDTFTFTFTFIQFPLLTFLRTAIAFLCLT